MYRKYFGLNEVPFSIAVDPRFLFMSDRHRDALAHLIYGVGVGGGFILLSGEVGTGKTTITRCLLEQLPDNTDIALVLNPALNAVELLAAVCDELDIAYLPEDVSLKGLSDKLHSFLLANHQRGRNTVLLIDEAQHLQFEVLEQIRLLTNLETNTKKLLQIILVGQPELNAILARPELRQLSQRITARYQLKPFTLEETRSYIRHRLQVAGLPANQEIFPARVVRHIQQVSGGIPRLINVLCDRILLGTYGKNKPVVDMAMARQAVAEVKGEDEELPKTPLPAFWSWIAAAVALLVVVLAWQPWRETTTLEAATEIPVAVAAQTKKHSTEPTDDDAAAVIAPQAQLQGKDTVLYFESQSAALNALLTSMGTIDTPLNYPCGELAKRGWRCEVAAVKSWVDLYSYNSPVVLEILTPGKLEGWASLLNVEGGQANLLTPHGELSVELDQLGKLWTGTFILPWHAPAEYNGPIRRSSSGAVVNWLSGKFAQLDGEKSSLADQQFNTALEQRIKLFQADESLTVDGVAGLKTLLRLEQRLGNAMPLLAVAAATSEAQ